MTKESDSAKVTFTQNEQTFDLNFMCEEEDKLTISLESGESSWENSFTLNELHHFDAFEQILEQVKCYTNDVKVTLDNHEDESSTINLKIKLPFTKQISLELTKSQFVNKRQIRKLSEDFNSRLTNLETQNKQQQNQIKSLIENSQNQKTQLNQYKEEKIQSEKKIKKIEKVNQRLQKDVQMLEEQVYKLNMIIFPINDVERQFRKKSLPFFEFNMDESDLFQLNDVVFIKKLIQCSQAQFSLIYKGSRDGFKSQKFYNLVDGASPILVLIKTKFSRIFGGYTRLPFTILPKNGNKTLFNKDPKSVVFSLSSRVSYELKPNRNSTCSQKGYIAKFSAWNIPEDCNIKQNCSIIGDYYHGLDNPQKINQFCGTQNRFAIEEIEAFQVIE